MIIDYLNIYFYFENDRFIIENIKTILYNIFYLDNLIFKKHFLFVLGIFNIKSIKALKNKIKFKSNKSHIKESV